MNVINLSCSFIPCLHASIFCEENIRDLPHVLKSGIRSQFWDFASSCVIFHRLQVVLRFEEGLLMTQLKVKCLRKLLFEDRGEEGT